VVRWGENGSGFNFILKDYENVMNYGIQPSEAIDRKTVERFLQKVGVPSQARSAVGAQIREAGA